MVDRKSVKKEKGFTIIELIVVVAIIAVLAAIVLVNVSSYLSKGRDARRVADLHQIQTALQLYYADHGNYPMIFSGPGSSYCSAITSSPNFIAPNMPSAPADPSWNGNVSSPNLPYSYEYCIRYSGGNWDTQNYMVMAKLEKASGNVDTSGSDWTGYMRGSGYNYVISNFSPP